MDKKNRWNRRAFLKFTGLGGAACLLFPQWPAFASGISQNPEDAPFLIHATFPGGWDQLLAFDPRDNTQYTDGKIIPAYDVLAQEDPGLAQTLSATGNTGLVTPGGSNISFGPAIGGLAEHFQKLCVVRGIDMGTLTHEVGKRYFLTGKFPRGLAANGSDLCTALAAQGGGGWPIPNMSLGMESYNEGLPAFATGLRVKTSKDLLAVLNALGEPISPLAVAAVDDFLWSGRCDDVLLDGGGDVTTFLESRVKAQEMASGEFAEYFQFVAQPKTEALKSLYDSLGIGTGGFNQDMNGPKGQAAIVAQAITNQISQTVAVQLSGNIDHHDDNYQTDHAPALREGFDALSGLISYLENTLDEKGRPYWDRTLLIVSSDFARTATTNSRSGRDHHLASSCAVAGMGIAGNQVIGATNNTDMGFEPVDLETGDVYESGVIIRPSDIHATALQALGADASYLSNQEPKIISKMLT